MKRTYDSSRFIAFFVKAGLIAAIAAVLFAPATVKAGGSETASAVGHAWPTLKRASFDALPLPPIPYLETMPWLARQRTPTGFKIDTLLGPTFEPLWPETASGTRPVNTSQARNLSASV